MKENENKAAPGTKKGKTRSAADSLQLRRGGYSVALCAAALAVVIVLNLLVGKLPAHITKPDISEESLYTLSEQTKQLVRGLAEPVEIYLLAETGAEDRMLAALLERYAALSSRLTVTYVDPIKNPYFYERYSQTPLAANSVVVSGEKRSKPLAADGDIYVTDYTINPQTYQPEPETLFDGENAVTSAIDFVTSDVLPVIYNLTGHGEAQLPETLKSAILKENIELKDLSMLTLDAVPADADCVFICTPETDISVTELELLTAYAEGGGSLLLLTDYSQTGKPNLMALAESFGLRAVDGLVYEGDTGRCLPGYPQYLLPEIAEHEITAPLLENKYSMLVPIAQGIVTLPAYRGTLTITPLLTTSAASYAMPPEDTAVPEQEEESADGPFYLAALSTEALSAGTSNFIWIGSSSFLAEPIDSVVSGANVDFFLNAIGWLCSKETSITVHGKAFVPAVSLVVSSASAVTWGIVLIGVLPAAIVISGVFVWIRRRRRV